MAKKRGFKRLVPLSDLHCGHRVGLTPQKWHRPEYALSDAKDAKFFKVAIDLWSEYQRIIDALKPIDILVVNGDAIDGKGSRSGGTEQITADRVEQVEMAKECVDYCEPGAVVCLYGTSYHTGIDEDFEDLFAEKVGAKKIGGQEWLDVNGVIFDFKHTVGSSTIPHGKFTPLSKERLWNLIHAEYEEQPKADVIVRSHVHYACYCGEPGWLALTTPALQGKGSKFGSRICKGIVHFGLTVFDVSDKGDLDWHYEYVRVESQKAKILKL